jgi:hypothetical protein
MRRRDGKDENDNPLAAVVVLSREDKTIMPSPLAWLAVERLSKGNSVSQAALGFIFDAEAVLASLGPDHSTFKSYRLDRPQPQQEDGAGLYAHEKLGRDRSSSVRLHQEKEGLPCIIE